jgi:hypothetical protein
MPFTLESTFHLHGHAGSSLGDPFHDPGDLSFGFAGSNAHLYGHAGSSLGQEFLINDSGDVSPVHGATTQSAATSRATPSNNSSAPAPTLVGAAGGLQFDLIWDSSVAKAPAAFESAIIAAAKYYTTLFSNDEVINIDVGYGEIGGSPLGSGALGESESYGYLTNYATVAHALDKDNYAPSSASNEPTNAQFFVTSAEAKTLGLISGSSTAVDGFIGLSNAYPMNHSTSGGAIASNQFDALAIAEHEISEVMGRIGMEGETVEGKRTYTPLDLFNYQSPHVLELSPNGGYFSVNNGGAKLGVYNDAAANGGDIADWASNASITQSATQGLPSGDYDAYDAFTSPGYIGDVSQSDIIEDAALGYELTSAGVAAA